MRQKNKSLWLAIFLLILFSTKATAQNTVINEALHSRLSIVTVKAFKTGMLPEDYNPQITDAITGEKSEIPVGVVHQFEKIGAGVIIDASGIIVTNFHTVYLADKLSIRFYEDTSTGAQIVHLMPDYDLALIKVDPPFELRPISFADSNQLQLGEEILHIGNSLILDDTISEGKIIGLGRQLNASGGDDVALIKVDLNLYVGDSGGPLLNKNNHLIGMMAAKDKFKDRSSYAIPSNKIKKLYLDFVK